MDMAKDIFLLEPTPMFHNLLNFARETQLKGIQKVALYVCASTFAIFDSEDLEKVTVLFPDMKRLYLIPKDFSPQAPPKAGVDYEEDDDTHSERDTGSKKNSDSDKETESTDDIVSKVFSIDENFKNKVLSAGSRERRLDIKDSHFRPVKTYRGLGFRDNFLMFFEQVSNEFSEKLVGVQGSADSSSDNVQIELALRAYLQRATNMWAFHWCNNGLHYDWMVSARVLRVDLSLIPGSSRIVRSM